MYIHAVRSLLSQFACMICTRLKRTDTCLWARTINTSLKLYIFFYFLELQSSVALFTSDNSILAICFQMLFWYILPI